MKGTRTSSIMTWVAAAVSLCACADTAAPNAPSPWSSSAAGIGAEEPSALYFYIAEEWLQSMGFEQPALAQAADGEIVSVSGRGIVERVTGSANGSGTYTITWADGSLRERGTWTASRLESLDFDLCGVSFIENQCAARATIAIALAVEGSPVVREGFLEVLFEWVDDVPSDPVAGYRTGITLDVPGLSDFTDSLHTDPNYPLAAGAMFFMRSFLPSRAVVAQCSRQEVASGHCAPATRCIENRSPGQHRIGGGFLSYDVSVPDQCASGCGLIVDVHGGNQSGDVEDRNTDMRALGRERGYIVVQPNAPISAMAASWFPALHDVQVAAFIEEAIEAWHVDRDRVHMTGFSQGGWMTWRFLCARPELFGSVAPMSASYACPAPPPACSFTGDAVPAVEVPILYIHGRLDGVLPFLGCADVQRDNVVAAWDLDQAEVVSQDDDHTWTRYRNDRGTVFEFIEHDYVAVPPDLSGLEGHCYVGSTDPGQVPSPSYACEGPNAFTAGEAIMDFFQAHPRR